MHESYLASKEANNFIQNIIENIFLIKLHGKGDQEILKIVESLSERKNYLYKNEIYGSLTAVLPAFSIFNIFGFGTERKYIEIYNNRFFRDNFKIISVYFKFGEYV